MPIRMFSSGTNVDRVGGKTIKFKGGACYTTGKGLTVNIGTVVFGLVKQKPPYFGLDIGQLKLVRTE